MENKAFSVMGLGLVVLIGLSMLSPQSHKIYLAVGVIALAAGVVGFIDLVRRRS